MKIKKVQLISLIICLVAILGILITNVPSNISASSKSISYNNSNLSIIKDNGVDGVLLYGTNKIDNRLILPIIGRSNIKAIAQQDGDINIGLDYLKSQLGVDKIIIVSSGDKVIDSFPCNISEEYNLSGVIMLSPAADVSSLISQGIYSCSYQTIVPTLIVESVTATQAGMQNAIELYNLLSGDTIKSNGSPMKASKGNVSINLTAGAVTTDLKYSRATSQIITEFISQNTGTTAINTQYVNANGLLSLVVIASLMVYLVIATRLSEEQQSTTSWQIVSCTVEKPWKYYLSRVALLLAALGVGLVLFIIFSMLYSGYNLLSKIFLSYFWGLGIAAIVLYRFEVMPGVKGRIVFAKSNIRIPAISHILVPLVLVVASGFALNLSGAFLINMCGNIITFILFTLLSVLSFIALSYEMIVVNEVSRSYLTRYLLVYISYIPLLLIVMLAVPSGLMPLAFALLRCFIVIVIGATIARIFENYTNSPYIGSIIGGLMVSVYLCSTQIF